MAAQIYCTAKIPDAGPDLLRERGLNVQIYDKDTAAPPSEIAAGLKNADALICLLSDSIDANIIHSAPRLKIIANYAAGYNNIDLSAAQEKGIIVTNTPDVLTAATADLTWALILAVSKRISESEQYLRQGYFKGWRPKLMLGGDVSGKTIGIVGAGRIGQAVARRAVGFDMRVLYHSRKQNTEFEASQNVEYLSLNELLAESDFISLHCPLSPETHHLINAQNISLIKKSAYLINTARGPVVDEQALIATLKSGQLAGAGFDVYEHEPMVPQSLLELDNVVLLPHIGSATHETRDEMARICARNIIEVLEGRPALTPVI